MSYKKYGFQVLSAFVVGFIFGIGLIFSGMTQPKKVISFLDVLGNWDPSVLFVMLAAIPVHFLCFKTIVNLPSPLLDIKWHYPTKKEITKSLIVGSLLFGIGWGLCGYCPGPAMVSVGSGGLHVIVFLISMTLGMWLFGKANEKFQFKR